MTAAAERLKAELTSLSSEDRADLARFLIVSLEERCDSDIETEWDRELERRAEEIRNGNALGEPAEKVLAELRAKYS